MALCSWGAGTGAWGCSRDQPVAGGRMRGIGWSWVWVRVRQGVPLLLWETDRDMSEERKVWSLQVKYGSQQIWVYLALWGS